MFCLLIVFILSQCFAISALDTSTKNYLLDIHNKYRRLVANGQELHRSHVKLPQAAAMPKMKWDSMLAQKAQSKADECRRPGQGVTDNQDYHQNLAFRSGFPRTTEKATIERLLRLWLGPIPALKPRYVKLGMYRHQITELHSFMKMITDESNRLGCGLSPCDMSAFTGSRLICYYAPRKTRWYQKSDVYVTGTTCSQCKGNCEDGLCIPKERSFSSTY